MALSIVPTSLTCHLPIGYKSNIKPKIFKTFFSRWSVAKINITYFVSYKENNKF